MYINLHVHVCMCERMWTSAVRCCVACRTFSSWVRGGGTDWACFPLLARSSTASEQWQWQWQWQWHGKCMARAATATATATIRRQRRDEYEEALEKCRLYAQSPVADYRIQTSRSCTLPLRPGLQSILHRHRHRHRHLTVADKQSVSHSHNHGHSHGHSRSAIIANCSVHAPAYRLDDHCALNSYQ